MNVREIRQMAKELQVKNYSRLRKDELIRAVQQAEGNTDCFLRIQDCGEQACAWREDCQS